MASIASSLMGAFGLAANAHEETGQGVIYERTIELGASIIAIDSIGTLRIIDTRRGHALTILGGIVALYGLILLFSSSKTFGAFLVLVGVSIAAWNLTRKLEVYLSIGTSDGQITTIISKERQFLKNLRDFLRRKIDTRSKEGARFDVKNCQFFGPTAMGTDPSAST